MPRTVLAAVLVLGFVACSRVVAREPRGAAEERRLGDRALDRTLVAGTLIEATVRDSRWWRRAAVGTTLAATVTGDVTNALQWAVIPAGSAVELRITSRRLAGNARGTQAAITLEVRAVTVRGRRYPVYAAAAMTAVTVPEPSGGVVGPRETRMLFVLSEGFTATLPPVVHPM